MRALTDLPLALGFGIGTPEQVAEAARLSDGVAVGTAIVKFIEDNANSPDLAAGLELWTRQLSSPLR
jgi:tryptophan synthase alpha chain